MPKNVDHESRRKDFVEAAYKTIIEEGLAKTTIRSVAKRAGYTTGALVHYFKDKDELIRYVLAENGRAVRARMQDARRTARGRDALRSVLLEALPVDKIKGASWRIWLALWYHSEVSVAMRKEERLRYREWIGRITEILNESVELGELRDDLSIPEEARSLVAFVDGLGVQYLMSNGRRSSSQITGALDVYLGRLYNS